MVETTPNWSQLGVGVVPHVKIWVEAVIPIDGIGSQSHLAAGNAGGVKAAVDALAGTGVLEVAITGSDITGAASDDYWVVTDVCLRVETCVGITTWGVSDGDSWGASQTPLFFYINYQPKGAHFAVANALTQEWLNITICHISQCDTPRRVCLGDRHPGSGVSNRGTETAKWLTALYLLV
ncbi:hypothetical protein DL766_007706 [Monosporascus sp. MC13-8B]|nr:hypothetical protein DL766_007706 [Monosporascus sp. MC13-8B]